MKFAEQLKAVRRREGYSQATAAQLIPGLSTRTLQAWECSQQSPPLWAQWLVLDALGGAPYDPSKKRRVSPVRKARPSKDEK
jgi:DNA-binding XRE family transcriptional regulator